jgi:hypothetical protein
MKTIKTRTTCAVTSICASLTIKKIGMQRVTDREANECGSYFLFFGNNSNKYEYYQITRSGIHYTELVL